MGDGSYHACMNLILVPGFWLGAWSWEKVTPALEEAGHHVTSMTRPGLESVDDDRTGIGMSDTIAAVVDLIDRADGDVVLVGHSGGGNVVYGAADRRPGRVKHIIYVDCAPVPHGVQVNPDLEGTEGVEVPLPEWDYFREGEDDDLRDLTDEMLEEIRSKAIPEPWGMAYDQLELTDFARYDIPMTIISTTFTSSEIDHAIGTGGAFFSELPHVSYLDIVELPTGHWPQFTKPNELAKAILDALS